MIKSPFSERVAQSTSLQQIYLLCEEIKNLLLNMMKTDKRSLKQELAKAIFKAKLNLYCDLYRGARLKFLEIQQEHGSNVHCKTPLTFERLMRDFNWQKTVTYSMPISKDEVDIDTMVDDLYEKDPSNSFEDELITIDKTKKMKPLFNRTEQSVITDALELTLVEFLDKYNETSADEKVLKIAYHDIRSKKEGNCKQTVIQDRVGNESSEDTLEATSPTMGNKKIVNPDYPLGAKVEFKFATGETLVGVIIDSSTFDKVTIEVIDNKKNSTKYPVSIDSITEIISFNEFVKNKMSEKVVIEKKTATLEPVSKTELAIDAPGKLTFKLLDKEFKISTIQELYDGGLKTTGEIKKKLSESYIINHYDDVYNVFIKIKK